MEKNVIVLFMSTLRLNDNNSKSNKETSKSESISTAKKDDNTMSIKPYKYTYEGRNIEGENIYYSQLEPVSKMIKETKGSLDKVIIFATEATKKKEKFTYGDEPYDGSAVDFYLSRVGIATEEEKKQKCRIIDVDDDITAKAIFDAVNCIKDFRNVNPDGINLWIDTQGGFRNGNMVLNAIISLLKSENIKPEGIYSVKFNFEKEEQYIQDQTSTYKIFDFVSGINEFIRYGRADQLDDYYKSLNNLHTDEETTKEPAVIKEMKTITNDIQMCDMRLFNKHLENLQNSILVFKKDSNEGKKDDLLRVFIEQIEADYGKMLEEEHTNLDIVEWLYKKKFYQQAITYIESQMPNEWIDVKEIIKYSKSEDEFTKLKERLNKGWEKDNNFVVDQIIYNCFRDRNICYKSRSGKQTRDYKTEDGLKACRKNYYKNKRKQIFIYNDENNENNKNNKNNNPAITVTLDNNYYDNIMNLLCLYNLLKNERNNFNHMSDKNEKADYKTLGKVIEQFISKGREVYNKIPSTLGDLKPKKIFINFTNHPSEKWSLEQLNAAHEYGDVIDIPFPNVSASASEIDINGLCEKLFNEIKLHEPSIVLCQGEFTLAFKMINRLLDEGIPVVAACSERRVVEKGNKKESIFNFTKFRLYER